VRTSVFEFDVIELHAFEDVDGLVDEEEFGVVNEKRRPEGATRIARQDGHLLIHESIVPLLNVLDELSL